MRLVRSQQIVGHPPRGRRIAHATIGQQRLHEQRPAAGQRGLDGELYGEDFGEGRGAQLHPACR